MSYRIGTIARLLGMSAEGIRMYERSGILRAQREKEENEYRSFDHLDITALIRARGYHYCGFTTREIETLINSSDVGEVTELYARKEEELRREIIQKQLQMECLEEFRRLTENAEEQLFQISRRQRPALYRFEFIRDGVLILGVPISDEQLGKAGARRDPGDGRSGDLCGGRRKTGAGHGLRRIL